MTTIYVAVIEFKEDGVFAPAITMNANAKYATVNDVVYWSLDRDSRIRSIRDINNPTFVHGLKSLILDLYDKREKEKKEFKRKYRDISR